MLCGGQTLVWQRADAGIYLEGIGLKPWRRARRRALSLARMARCLLLMMVTMTMMIVRLPGTAMMRQLVEPRQQPAIAAQARLLLLVLLLLALTRAWALALGLRPALALTLATGSVSSGRRYRDLRYRTGGTICTTKNPGSLCAYTVNVHNTSFIRTRHYSALIAAGGRATLPSLLVFLLCVWALCVSLKTDSLIRAFVSLLKRSDPSRARAHTRLRFSPLHRTRHRIGVDVLSKSQARFSYRFSTRVIFLTKSRGIKKQ